MTQWLRINLLMGLIMMLAACGGGTTADSGAQPVPIASADVPAPSTSVFVPAPSTSAGTVVEPSSAPSEVSSAASVAPASSPVGSSAASGVVAVYTRSGGIQGKTQTLVVNGDGNLQLLNGDRTGQVVKTAQAPAGQVEALRSSVTSPEWQQLEGKYGRQVPDGFAYTISANGKEVGTFDGASNPAALEAVLTQLNDLWQIAQTAT